MNVAEILAVRANELGFIACGISKAQFLEEEKNHLIEWLQRGYHGEMSYLERNLDKRLDPALLVEGTKSIISVAYNYFPKTHQNSNSPQIAKYAYGEDYHRVLKDRCHELIEPLKQLYPEMKYRVFVDSAPVMERQWAQKSGIGWIGKNSLLLRKGVGSFFFLGEIFVDVTLPVNTHQVTDHCGTCTRCMDACPTQAIIQEQVIDATKCISYLSIEKPGLLDEKEKSMMHGWAFGCDICQDVCPWNRFSEPHDELRFDPVEAIHWNESQWKSLDENRFNDEFKNNPISRMGYKKLKQLLS